jgi:hypothetical protein
MLVRILRTYQLPEILMLAAATLCVVVGVDKHACHIWLCPKCYVCFSSVVSFPADTDTEFNEGYPDREPFAVSAAAGRLVREFHMTRQTISRLAQ